MYQGLSPPPPPPPPLPPPTCSVMEFVSEASPASLASLVTLRSASLLNSLQLMLITPSAEAPCTQQNTQTAVHDCTD